MAILGEAFRREEVSNFKDDDDDGATVRGRLLNWVFPVKADAVDRSRHRVAINRLVILYM